ncbi:MAG: Tetratricopeptide repeat protein [Gemmataceae bacterium]|nr:Tetratricopeptide repeat protein [Gemmataceae bacterium]
MSNDTNPLPPEPTGQDPHPHPRPDHTGNDPAGDELPFELPELADLDLAGLSDPTIPLAEGEPEPEGGAVSFNLLDPGEGDGDRTIGVAFADLPDIPGLSPPAEPAAGPGADRPPAGHGTPLHIEEVEPVAEFAPVSEILPLAEPESVDADIPTADAAEVEVFALWAEPAADDLLPLAEAVPFEEVGDPPTAESASSSGLFGDVPTAGPASSSNLFGGVPTAQPVSSGDRSGAIPTASAADSGVVPEAEAVGWPDDDADVGNLEPLSPLTPGSGWLDSQADDQLVPDDLQATEEPPSVPIDVIAAGLAGPAPHPHIEGSDIFASGPVPTAPAADASDVIAATAYAPADPMTPIDPPVPVAPSGRGSDVALTFDQPPGGSTVGDPRAEDGMPVADEVSDAPDSLFDVDDSLFDSARLAGTPDLPGEGGFRDDADLGAAPPGAVDASSILADLSDPDSSLPGESSAIRLEAPGMDVTLTDDPPPDFAADATEPDEVPAWGAPHGSGEPTDWESQSGSDLFADRRTQPEFELLPETGAIDPFGDDADLDQPSLSSAASSIFSGAKPPAGSGRGSSDVPVETPDPADAVEFSDHPDLEAADSDSLHISAGGRIDFDMEDSTRPDMTTRVPFPDDDEVDWSAAEHTPGAPGGPVSGILSSRGGRPANAEPGSTEDAPVAHLFGGPPAEPPPAKGKKKDPAPGSRATDFPPPPPKSSDPSVVLDWVADSNEQEALPPAKTRPKAPAARAPEPREGRSDRTAPAGPRSAAAAPAGVNRRGAAGLFLGLLLGVGMASGVYFSDILPQKGDGKPVGPTVGPPTTQGGTPQNGGPATQPAGPGPVADATAAMSAGDPARAVKVMEKAGMNTAEGKATLGQARFFARVRELGQTNAAVTADDPGLKLVRTDLEAVVNDPEAAKTPDGEKTAVRAALHLGLTHELVGDRTKAREVYADGLKKFPRSAEVFQAALDRVAATDSDAGKTSFRLAPADAEQLAAAAVILLALGEAPQPAPAAEEPPEAGPAFWKAVNSAAAGKYADAADQIAKAKAAHEKRAKALAGRGLNPLTDPLEQIFPKCCDDLKAYWELRRALYDHPAVGPVVKKEGVAKALDQLAAAEKQSIELTKTAADLKKKNDTLATDLKKANDQVVSIEKELKTEQEAVVKLDKDLKAAKETAADLEGKLKKTDDALTLAEKGRKDAAAVLDAIAKELQGVKLLPEKYDTAALLAANKSAASRATGPDLAKLVPPELSAVAGVGLTTGHLLDLAGRVNKAEAAAKAAAADLEKTTTKFQTEITRLKTDHDAAVNELTAGYAAETKKLTAAHAAELKKQAADGATTIDTLKEAHAANLKKLADKFADDTKKVAAAHAEKVKELETNVAAEQLRLAAAEKRFRAEIGDALSPARSLDLWLPVLVELRRPADADPALDAAGKTLKTAEPGSEDAAKAMTVAGLALLLKNDVPGAKVMFSKARATPAYVAGKGKGWAQAADIGAAAVVDPAAPARRPVEGPRKDPAAAARFLDAGIGAYKAGRYADAEKALAEAAWNDPDGVLAWYFLGAARWETGKTEQAKADFKQGAEREQGRTIPAREIDAALGPIQGAARDALTAARP